MRGRSPISLLARGLARLGIVDVNTTEFLP